VSDFLGCQSRSRFCSPWTFRRTNYSRRLRLRSPRNKCSEQSQLKPARVVRPEFPASYGLWRGSCQDGGLTDGRVSRNPLSVAPLRHFRSVRFEGHVDLFRVHSLSCSADHRLRSIPVPSHPPRFPGLAHASERPIDGDREPRASFGRSLPRCAAVLPTAGTRRRPTSANTEWRREFFRITIVIMQLMVGCR
jgi:hypothetical protein